MAVVTIMCSRTGDFVSTGVEMDEVAFAALPPKLSRTRCPSCGLEHVWAKGSAWLSGQETSLPARRLEASRALKAKTEDPLLGLLKRMDAA